MKLVLQLLLIAFIVGLSSAARHGKKAPAKVTTTARPTTTAASITTTQPPPENPKPQTSPSCPTCFVERCPNSPQECSHGLVKDECGCCKEGVCLLHEREKCLNLKLTKNITETDLKKLSVCGEYSKCILRTDVKAGEIEESVCQCQSAEVSCGNDNTTYLSICQLKEAGAELKHAGACMSAPIFTSEPEVVPTQEEERFSLNCEAKGFPVPDIHWEFEGLNGLFKSLPGDDPSIAVHNRGGPEPFTVSSWVMIEALRQSDAGTYICVARNSQGVARSVATVSVPKHAS